MTNDARGHHVHGDARQVYASSHVRLSFEPKGTALAFRTEMRIALAALRPSAAGVLRGTYHAVPSSRCDVENVLFYNVGMSWFRPLASRGLVFERSYDAWPDEHGHANVHHYEVDERAAFRHWRVDPAVATFAAAMPRRGDAPTAAWWHAVVAAGVTSLGTIATDAPFALVVRVGGDRCVLTSLLKPAFDGAIAAFHRDPAPDSVVAERVAGQLEVSVACVMRALGGSGAVLGDRAVVHRRGDGVQWNPADDRCVAGALLLDDSLPAGTFTGALHPVDAIARPA